MMLGKLIYTEIASLVDRISRPSFRCGREGWLASKSLFILESPKSLAAQTIESRLGLGIEASLGTRRPSERDNLESKYLVQRVIFDLSAVMLPLSPRYSANLRASTESFFNKNARNYSVHTRPASYSDFTEVSLNECSLCNNVTSNKVKIRAIF